MSSQTDIEQPTHWGVLVMDRRNIGAGFAVLASGFVLLGGVASAHGGAASANGPGTGTCTVKSLPSFVAQGEFGNAATVGDVIEVSCDPFTYSAGAAVTVTASQLYSRCKENISWYIPNESGRYRKTWGRSVTLKLDVDGNANVGLIAGPKCMVGESLITVDEVEAPYETYTTAFQVLPAVNTPAGLYITPESQVEDAESSAVVTIAQAEFSGASEEHVRVGAGQLYSRCQSGKHLIFVKENREEFPNEEWSTTTTYQSESRSELLDAIELDNNGNGFVMLIGSDSCAEGPSLIESDLEGSPFTTQTGTFTVESPRVRN
jgi:hypothetical protein